MANLVITAYEKIVAIPSYSTGLSKTYNMISWILSVCVFYFVASIEITVSIS